MTKWDYFQLGVKTCAFAVMLYTLLFAEVTLWPMKQPLWKHCILYPLAAILLVLGLITSIEQMWR